MKREKKNKLVKGDKYSKFIYTIMKKNCLALFGHLLGLKYIIYLVNVLFVLIASATPKIVNDDGFTKYVQKLIILSKMI